MVPSIMEEKIRARRAATSAAAQKKSGLAPYTSGTRSMTPSVQPEPGFEENLLKKNNSLKI